MNTISATELKQSLDNNADIKIIDVRESQELEICSIESAIHFPMSEAVTNMSSLEEDTAYVVMCHHGMRSAQVGMYLEQNGFTNITNLTGGIHAWATDVDPEMATY